MYLVFGALILVFVMFFGPGSSGCMPGAAGSKADTFAAKVNGETIGWREFETAYGNMLRAYQQQMGERFDSKMAEQMGLKANVLDGLIERRLLISQAKAQGIAVSDAEVAAKLREITAFHKDGHFDYGTYRQVIQTALGVTPDKFEVQVREDLLREKMVAVVRQGAKASDDEIQAEFAKENDKADLVFVRFLPAQAEGEAKPTAAEIDAYLATEDGKKAVADEFEAKSFRFKKPKRVKAQHILVKVAEDAPQADVDAATAKLDEAKKKIIGGTDFGAIAQELSDDPGSKDKGGDLGFFGPGTMAKPFEEAAMALLPGQLSDVVRTRFGVHLIKVNDVQEPEEKKLEEVQGDLAADLLVQKKAKDLAKAKAQAALAKAKAGESLEALFPAPDAPEAGAAKAPKPVAEKTGAFAVASDFVPRLGMSADLTKAASAAAKGDVLPEVYEVNGGFVVAQAIDRTHPDPSVLEKTRDEVAERVVSRKEGELVEAYTKELRKSAKVETSAQLGDVRG
ncbi:Survival protein SurA precursor (Peptidyl-prolyl cis-trans isomerase SurA) [Vulgatibacter incomptus]|uniref:Survival protein SurA (Peptidyl-prolyl cis-trans isomerase SurA) n=2 Tax=Vulgatibacter incomptus TaxID=1391653 RepID=A0A0K1PCI5_9BACT|nr:Survival protein SurA precursor (Peptidyl-prolyl cis-trans isomerase SurA) [Vulgatibacter incomptus]